MDRLLLVLWLFPIFEFSCMVVGLTRARGHERHHHQHGGPPATEAIIQVTTIGNHAVVNEIISAIRAYDLPFPYQFWVVTEPGVADGYLGADEVVVVPAEFTALSSYKARAQEYSRRLRSERGLARDDVKIIMLDDDSLPTAKYLTDVYEADYDICEGILAPRRGYGRLLSHFDDLRTYNCLVVCSLWQGVGHPIWVHGEGLCLRGSAEAKVTWNFPVLASEDLTVGQNAVERGLSWGFVWEYVQLRSPFTFRDFLRQRRRWTWGNIYALRQGLIPPLGSALVVGRLILGLIIELLVTAALILVPLGIWHPAPGLLPELYVALGLWLGTFAFACWIGSEDEGASVLRRLINTVVGVVLAPITSFATTAVLIISVLMGDPKRFEVIAKSHPPLEDAP